MNFTTTHIRSEKVTIDTRIYTILNGRKKPGEVYLAAIAPDMELTIITLDEAPGILPCFEEDDACLNLPNTSLLLCYNPAQVLKMGGKHYLTGPVILVRTNMDGEVISLTIDEVYLFQKYLASHSITLMADDQKLPCICMLNQAAGDRQILAKQLNISPHQLSYVTHSGEGEGLLFFGNVILPFVDRFPTDLELYRIMTTKLGEVSEGAQK